MFIALTIVIFQKVDKCDVKRDFRDGVPILVIEISHKITETLAFTESCDAINVLIPTNSI